MVRSGEAAKIVITRGHVNMHHLAFMASQSVNGGPISGRPHSTCFVKRSCNQKVAYSWLLLTEVAERTHGLAEAEGERTSLPGI